MSARHATASGASRYTKETTGTSKSRDVSSGHRGHYKVASSAVSGPFSGKLVLANQCICGENYVPPTDCIETTYFTAIVVDVVKKAVALASVADSTAPTAPMLTKLAEVLGDVISIDDGKAILELHHLNYGQLSLVRNPIISGRNPPADQADYVPDTFFETYTVVEQKAVKGVTKLVETVYVQAPASEVRSNARTASVHAVHPSHTMQGSCISIAHSAGALAVHPPAAAPASHLLSNHFTLAAHCGSTLTPSCVFLYLACAANSLFACLSAAIRSYSRRRGHHCFVCPK